MGYPGSRAMGARSRPSALVALALAVGLSAVVACSGYVHTDDGCAFETHCRSCLWSANSIVVMVAAVVVRPVFEIVADVSSPIAPAFAPLAGRGATSRGPPFSG